MRTLASLVILGASAGLSTTAFGADTVLDLCGLKPTFMEEFNDLSVESRDIGSARWIAHTPWNGDFGDAIFSDPVDGFPFTVKDGIASITATKDESGKWRSGFLASADGSQRGFSSQYGYFEARMKLPAGPGVWPAFWLGTSQPADSKDPSLEIDVIEYYGHSPAAFQSSIHIWRKEPDKSEAQSNETAVPLDSLTNAFHTYGVMVDPTFITYYLDRKEIWKVPTPEIHKRPLLLMANLALGSGFPIINTPDPSVLQIDYIHAYQLKDASEQAKCKTE